MDNEKGGMTSETTNCKLGHKQGSVSILRHFRWTISSDWELQKRIVQ